MDAPKLITSLDTGTLLIFYGFGIAFLALTMQMKITFTKEFKPGEISKLVQYKGLYSFIKNIFNWGILYFVASVLVLIGTMPIINIYWQNTLINASFIIVLSITAYFSLLYIFLVIRELLVTWLISSIAGLQDKEFGSV